MNAQTNDELVAEIHDAFYSADERLLQEAKELLNTPQEDKAKKAERIKKLGFVSAKPVAEVAGHATKAADASKLIKAIEYWRVHYPNNKFITEPEVKKICEKYGLVLGEAGKYLGDIPEKNLSEIEAFQLRPEDYIEQVTYESTIQRLLAQYRSVPDIQFPEPPQYESPFLGIISSERRRSGLEDAFRQQMASYKSLSMLSFLDPFGSFEKPKYQKEPEKKVEKIRPAFKICAPQTDFNTSGYVVREGYILVYDPVVLQPVKDGYLIVSAWGKEASDELVINQNHN
jgi:hypothetical protein